MTTFINAIADGIREFTVLHEQYRERVKSLWELRSEYRRLKQMHACDANQMFSNSRMLPLSKTFTRDETICRNFWQHKRRGTSFDCCTLHRSRKQFLLSLVQIQTAKSEQELEHNVVELQRKVSLRGKENAWR